MSRNYNVVQLRLQDTNSAYVELKWKIKGCKPVESKESREKRNPGSKVDHGKGG